MHADGRAVDEHLGRDAVAVFPFDGAAAEPLGQVLRAIERADR